MASEAYLGIAGAADGAIPGVGQRWESISSAVDGHGSSHYTVKAISLANHDGEMLLILTSRE
jgi:hypothetical protein